MKYTNAGLPALICGATLLVSGAQARMSGTLLTEYSVFSQNEVPVSYLHCALVQAMELEGYQRGEERPVDGQGTETWYHPGLDQTVRTVLWSTEAGFAQVVFRQAGKVKAWGVQEGSSPSGETRSTLPEDTDSTCWADQQRLQRMATFREKTGFRPIRFTVARSRP